MFILYYGAPICLKFVSASMISTMRRQEKNCYSQHEANKAGPTTKHKTSLLNSAFLTNTMNKWINKYLCRTPLKIDYEWISADSCQRENLHCFKILLLLPSTTLKFDMKRGNFFCNNRVTVTTYGINHLGA